MSFEKRSMLVFIPTYNEVENIEPIYREICSLRLDTEFLFLDDNSPDGTGAVIDRLAAESSRVHAIHRAGKLGIGSAHAAGIKWAYEHGYETLVTMDCDFTHRPSSIVSLLEYKDRYDVVVGSRFIEKDSLPDWILLRRVLTHFGHFMTRFVLGMPLDATGAFRLYQLDRIPPGMFNLVQSPGYSFFFESLYILWLNKVSIKEVAVSLPARAQGHSKMTVDDAIYSLKTLLSVRRRRNQAPETLRYGAAKAPLVRRVGEEHPREVSR